MRSLLVWASLLVFFGTGNILVAIILLIIAFLMPAQPKKITVLPTGKARAGKPTWKTAVRGKDAAALHHGLLSEFSKSKRFAQILNSNLHFLAPLSEIDAKRLMEEASIAAIADHRSGSLAGLIKELLPGATEADIDRIAETAIHKVQAAINQTRAERLELTWYIWRTCQDQRVRSSHAPMEGVVCSFLDPPRPEALIGETDIGAYNPGECRECRCYAEPILDPNFETWPRKAVLDGKLVNIDIREFKAFSRETSR